MRLPAFLLALFLLSSLGLVGAVGWQRMAVPVGSPFSSNNYPCDAKGGVLACDGSDGYAYVFWKTDGLWHTYNTQHILGDAANGWQKPVVGQNVAAFQLDTGEILVFDKGSWTKSSFSLPLMASTGPGGKVRSLPSVAAGLDMIVACGRTASPCLVTTMQGDRVGAGPVSVYYNGAWADAPNAASFALLDQVGDYRGWLAGFPYQAGDYLGNLLLYADAGSQVHVFDSGQWYDGATNDLGDPVPLKAADGSSVTRNRFLFAGKTAAGYLGSDNKLYAYAPGGTGWVAAPVATTSNRVFSGVNSTQFSFGIDRVGFVSTDSKTAYLFAGDWLSRSLCSGGACPVAVLNSTGYAFLVQTFSGGWPAPQWPYVAQNNWVANPEPTSPPRAGADSNVLVEKFGTGKVEALYNGAWSTTGPVAESGAYMGYGGWDIASLFNPVEKKGYGFWRGAWAVQPVSSSSASFYSQSNRLPAVTSTESGNPTVFIFDAGSWKQSSQSLILIGNPLWGRGALGFGALDVTFSPVALGYSNGQFVTRATVANPGSNVDFVTGGLFSDVLGVESQDYVYAFPSIPSPTIPPIADQATTMGDPTPVTFQPSSPVSDPNGFPITSYGWSLNGNAPNCQHSGDATPAFSVFGCTKTGTALVTLTVATGQGTSTTSAPATLAVAPISKITVSPATASFPADNLAHQWQFTALCYSADSSHSYACPNGWQLSPQYGGWSIGVDPGNLGRFTVQTATANTANLIVSYGDSPVRTAQAAITLTVNGMPPTADFSFSSPAYENAPVTFTDASTADTSTLPTNAIQTWNWDFGDGGPADSSQNPTHTYSAAGTYNVQLTVTDALPLSASVTKQVTVSVPAAPGASVGYASGPRLTTANETNITVTCLDNGVACKESQIEISGAPAELAHPQRGNTFIYTVKTPLAKDYELQVKTPSGVSSVTIKRASAAKATVPDLNLFLLPLLAFAAVGLMRKRAQRDA